MHDANESGSAVWTFRSSAGFIDVIEAGELEAIACGSRRLAIEILERDSARLRNAGARSNNLPQRATLELANH